MSTQPFSAVQGPEADYALHTLGWKGFQDLCLAVAAEVFGTPIEMFLPSQDGGRDGAFLAAGGDRKSTIQCKSSSKSNASIRLSDVAPELTKAAVLADRGLADHYILMTSLGVSGTAAAEIEQAFLVTGVRTFQIFGKDWISAQIRQRPRLRMMVPRVYGLGDLSQIIDQRVYLQARYILSAMGDDLRCFVTTDAHRRSVEALTRHGFVLLLGDPASGKSTIGATLAVGALDDGAVGTIKVSSPGQFRQHWNPDEPNQFFWVDDAFGPTQYQRARVDAWNQELSTLRGAVKSGARVLFTSRTYIWEAARKDLKLSHFPMMGSSQVIIDVHQLAPDERAQILYNHIRMGDQPPPVRKTVKPFLAAISSNDAFLPETARRLGSSFFTKKLNPTLEGLTQFFEKPVDFLKEVLEGLDIPSQAAIALIFLHGQSGVMSPVEPSAATAVVERLLGVNLAEIARALQALNGSLALLVQQPLGSFWTYKHPTIRDAFASLIGESSELVELYVLGARLDRLLSEVVCGNTTIVGASLRIQQRMYPLLLARLAESPQSYYVKRFLVARCDEDFLIRFLEEAPGYADMLVKSIHSNMAYDANTDFLARLRKCDLLSEDQRAAASAQITRLTITMVDTSVFHDKKLRSILTASEARRLRMRFKRSILGQMDQVIESWRNDWSVQDERAHLEELKTNLERYDTFASLYEKRGSLTAGIAQLDEMIKEIENTEEPSVGRHVTPTSPISPSTVKLSAIFDDVDE